MRVKAVITYDGSTFLGFQKQKSTKNTIQYAIENALRSLQIDSGIVASGRTDAGVHASGQVIHFDLPTFWTDLSKLKLALNRKLKEVQFKHITKVPHDFHARFSARKRLYRYVFKTDKVSVFEQKYISQYQTFNTRLLKEALTLFEGKHNFDYFHKTGTITHSTVREIYRTTYIQQRKHHTIYIQANGFLRSQVRMMVNAAMLCATGKLTLINMKKQLACSEKYTTGLAPPEGLYLAHVSY